MTYLQRTLRMICNKHEMMATFSVMSASAFNYVSRLSQKYFPTQGAKKRMGWGGVGWGCVRWVTEIYTHTSLTAQTHTCMVWGGRNRRRKEEKETEIQANGSAVWNNTNQTIPSSYVFRRVYVHFVQGEEFLQVAITQGLQQVFIVPT